MSIVECVIAVQTNGTQAQPSNPPEAWYLIVVLLAVVMALVVLVFIRSNARRSSKR